MRILKFCQCQSRHSPSPLSTCRTHLQTRTITAEHTREVQLLHLLLESTGEAWVHGRPAREHNVLVQLGARVDGCLLNCLEEEF